MKKIIFIVSFVFFIFIIPLVSSWGPHAHNYILDQVKVEGQENDIVRECLDGGINEEAFRAGLVIPDITVVYYFSEGGKNYKATHNWNFQQELMAQALTDDEKCFAYGVAAHLIQDSIAHTDAIPKKIEKIRVPNWISHPLLEKKYDSELVLEHPELMDETRNMLNAMYGNKGNKYISMIEASLGENVQINVKEEVDNLAFALDSFYDDAFKPKAQENSLFAIYPYIDKLTNFMHPYVGKWNVQDLYFYMGKNVETTINVYNNWGSRYALSPHGFSELNQADEKASWFVPGFMITLITLSVVIPLGIMVKKRKFKYAFLFLLIIPIIILTVTIIYMIL